MGFNDELEIKTADDLVKEQLDTDMDLTAEELNENAEEKTVDSSEDDVSEQKDETASNEEAEEQDGEITDADASEEPKKKRKFPLQVPVIISTFIVLGALLGYFIFIAFFLHEPEGLWMITVKQDATGAITDEDTGAETDVTYYYEFKKDGTCIMSIGSIDNYGGFYKTQTEDANSLYVNQYYGIIYGDLKYTVTGSKILNNQKLILEGESGSFELTQARAKENHLEVDKDFVPNEELLGEWEYVIPEYNVSYTFTFNRDGTMTYNQLDTVVYNATYTVDEKNVHMSFYATEPVTVDLPYTINGDTISLMDMVCTRVTDQATADEK